MAYRGRSGGPAACRRPRGRRSRCASPGPRRTSSSGPAAVEPGSSGWPGPASAARRARWGGAPPGRPAGAARAPAVARRLAAAAGWVARMVGAGDDPALTAAPSGVAVAGWEAYRRAIRQYVPAGDGGEVHLLRAAVLRATRPDLGWASLLPGLEIEVVPGDHHTCVTR